MKYAEETLNWFNHLNLQRKISLGASLALIFLSVLCLGYWMLSPRYAVLFNHLDSHDANQILKQLDAQKIPYQLRHGGSEVLISESLIDKTRLNIMGSGMQWAGSVGFELFDKSDFGMTDFSQKINYQRALQGELERTISSLDEVSHARVHLVTPEQHLFEQEDNPPKASVTLHLKKKLTPKQVRSVQQLITSSVAHLTADHVVVLDQNGNTLTSTEEDSGTTQFTTKKTIEHYLNDKVSQMLHQIFKDKDVLVKIDASLNYDELQRERIRPQSQGIVTHEKHIKHSTSGRTKKDTGNQDVTLEKSYQLGSEKELYKRASGTLQRLSVSVVVPKDTDEKTVAQVKRLVKTVVGFDERRGDTITVEALGTGTIKTYTPYIPPNIPPTPTTSKTQHLMLITLGACMTLCVPALYVARRLRRQKRQQLLIELTQWLTHHES